MQTVVVNIEGMRTHRVEEVAVVRHDKDCILEIRQIVFEPGHCVEVKVVGRFVEKKIVGIAKKSLCQEDADLLVGADVAHQHAMTVFFNAKATEQGCSIALGIPALELGETFFELGRTHTVGIAEVGFGIQRVFLLHNIPQDGVTAEDGFEHSAVVEFKMVLLEDAHTLARTLGN